MKKKKLIEAIFVFIGSIVSLVLSILSFIFVDDSIGNIIILSIAGIIIGLSTSYLLITIANLKSQQEDKKEIDQYYETLRGSVRIITNSENIKNKNIKTIKRESDLNKLNILELMLANMKEIKEYYILSKSQAKKSFTTAIVMGVLGFVLISISIVIAVILKENIAAIIIPAIGAVVVDLLSAIFLFVYKKSLEQLNHYYSELHENEKFLSAVNLIDYINIENRDEIYLEIIRNRLAIEKN